MYHAVREAVLRLIRSRRNRPGSSAGPVHLELHDMDSEARAREPAAELHAALNGHLERLALPTRSRPGGAAAPQRLSPNQGSTEPDPRDLQFEGGGPAVTGENRTAAAPGQEGDRRRHHVRSGQTGPLLADGVRGRRRAPRHAAPLRRPCVPTAPSRLR